MEAAPPLPVGLLALFAAAGGAAAQAEAQAPLAAAPLWSLQPPVRGVVPTVQRTEWPRSDLDRFVLAKLEQAGLEPAPEADRATLLRRLSLDLTGLPPTPDELAAFLADPAPDAYERTVDRLLASPQHGERMAQMWLDLARYSDTNGFDFDSDRQMWIWRDWVVRAFAEDMPFDQFTVEQVAGDLLPQATLQQRIATGFHRNHAVAIEGDGEPGEYLHQYVANRTATFASTWLGLSVGCAECHDHKFDPITQRDYYGLYAFWNRMPEKGLELGPNAVPFLRVPSAEQGAALLELQAKLEDVERALQQGLGAEAAAFEAWSSGLRDAPAAAADLLHESLDGPRAGAAEVGGIGAARWTGGIRGRAVHLDGNDAFVRLQAPLELRADADFTVSAWVRLEDDGRFFGRAVVAKVDEAAMGRGWQLVVDERQVTAALVGGGMDRISVRSRDQLAFGSWHHVAFTYDGSRRKEGLRLWIDGAPAPLAGPRPGTPVPDPKKAADKALQGDLDNDGALRIGGIDGNPFCGAIDEVRIHGRALGDAEVAALVDTDLGAMVGPARHELLLRMFARRGSPVLAPLAAERLSLRARHDDLVELVPQVSVVADMDAPRPTRLLQRGDFQRPGEVVEPAIPAVFGALPEGAPHNRLGLAQWLVQKDHPLVARVHTNRLWRWFFGRGLVETLDDFGARGERPSHPELLDWLAREFVDGGFGHRRFVRLLVLSATYRQSSVAGSAVREADPDNRLLARAARHRLDAEALRDQALAVAGLLDRRIGGPAVMPWQPEDLWPEPSPVADRYRRGLYVAQKRGIPFVTFRLLDAPARETCVPRRDRTTTPLQALALWNDRNFAEAARALAQRLLAEAADDEARLQRGFLLCLQRPARPAELGVLRFLLARQREHFASDPELAVAAASVGDHPLRAGLEPLEVAAWAAVAAVLLNLDEFLVRA